MTHFRGIIKEAVSGVPDPASFIVYSSGTVRRSLNRKRAGNRHPGQLHHLLHLLLTLGLLHGMNEDSEEDNHGQEDEAE